MLDRLLYSDFQRRVGGELTDKQKDRLVKTVKHYMTEVYAKKPGESVQFLNKEVLTSVVPDYMAYLRRSNGPAVPDTDVDPELRMDVSARFGQLQNERQELRQPPPLAPDFQMSLTDDGPTPLSRFEEIKRMREAEAARDTELIASRTVDIVSQELVVSTQDSGMGRFINSDVDFRNESEAARQRDRLAVIMREAERAAGQGQTEIVNAPDPRRSILIGDSAALPPKAQSFANGNPTTALPERTSVRPPLPQDIIRPQESIVAYKELEHNLFVYSADRDWVNNSSENRYNFSVNFDPANNQSGFGYNTATNIKFKNIVRIEFVKAIMPTEGIDVLPVYDMSGAVHVLNTDLNVSVLSLPYLQVRIPELNVNGYGTNDGINNAFAAISYDAYWSGDSSAKNKGYTRMIPKFLKCQKVYYPTPLATLQKLSFQIQKPDGTLVSTTTDTMDISGIYMPTSGLKHYSSATFDWLWIRTKAYFSKFMLSQGDRIVFKNIAMNATLVAANPSGVTNLITFLTRPEGHLVSDIGAMTGTDASPTYFDTGVNGPGYSNAAGYSNGIIIRNSFADPSTGSTSVSPWISASTGAFVTSLNAAPTVTTGRLINMNHQIQIIMRVITREMDAAAKLRPDNLQA